VDFLQNKIVEPCTVYFILSVVLWKWVSHVFVVDVRS